MVPAEISFPTGILLLTYFLLVLWLYIQGIGPIWNYLSNPPQLIVLRALASALLVFGVGCTLKARKPSEFYFAIATALILVPSMALYASTQGSETFVINTLVAFVTLWLVLQLPALAVGGRAHAASPVAVAYVLVAASAVLAAVVAIRGGESVFNLNILVVYDFREEATENLGSGLAYLVPAATNVAIPMAILLGIQHRRLFLVGSGFALSILYFGLVSLKSYLFYPFLIVAVYYFLNSRRPVRTMLFALVGVVVISLIECWMVVRDVTDVAWFTMLTSRRMLLIPSIINYLYVDLFEATQFYFWSTSKVTLGMLTPPASQDIAELVGSTYFNAGNHANTGWIGSGYAQAGMIGVILYSMLLGLILRIFDGSAERSSATLASAAFFIPALNMITSSDTLTVFLTQGLLFALLLIALMGGEGSSPRSFRLKRVTTARMAKDAAGFS